MHRNGGSPGGLCGSHGFGTSNTDSNRNNFYGNFGGQGSSFDRGSDMPTSSGGYANSFMDSPAGMGLYGGNGGHGMRSNNMVNNPMWSQFEKIRNEFQLKNSQYVEQQQQEAAAAAALLNRNGNFPFSDSMRGSAFSAVSRNSFQQDILSPMTSKAPGEGKCGFGEDLSSVAMNHDLQDLWASQKFGGNSGSNFCWPHDTTKSPLDASLGQAFNALNISER